MAQKGKKKKGRGKKKKVKGREKNFKYILDYILWEKRNLEPKRGLPKYKFVEIVQKWSLF